LPNQFTLYFRMFFQIYCKQMLREIELRENPFNHLQNHGAALLNQGHPALAVIEVNFEGFLSIIVNWFDFMEISLKKTISLYFKKILFLIAIIDAQNKKQPRFHH